MKSLLFISMFSLFGIFYSSAQNYSDLVIFSADGQKLFVEVNGQRYNQTPATNVRASGITQNYVTVKVIFAEANFPPITKNMTINPGKETTAQVALNRKGEYKLRWMGETSIQSAPVVEETSPASNSQPVTQSTVSQSQPTQTTTTTTITQSSSSTSNPQSAQVDMNVSMGGESVNVKVKADEPMGNGNVQQTMTYSETVTTTTTSSSSSSVSAEEPRRQADCYPMSVSDFSSAKESIRSKSFEDSKLTLAKQIVGANCLNTNQVKEMMGLFTYEETKLDFAKLAYKKTTDKNNYFRVNDAFTYESSIDELNAFINP